jgi:hypothetical protein
LLKNDVKEAISYFRKNDDFDVFTLNIRDSQIAKEFHEFYSNRNRLLVYVIGMIYLTLFLADI